MFNWLKNMLDKKSCGDQSGQCCNGCQPKLDQKEEAFDFSDGYTFSLNKNPDAAIVIALDNKLGEMLVITDIINNEDIKTTAETLARCLIFTLEGYLASTMLESVEDWSIEGKDQKELEFKQNFMVELKKNLDFILAEADKKNEENLTNLKMCVDAGDVFK